MNTSHPQHSTSESTARSNCVNHRTPARSTVSWGAIFAGASAGLALYVLFMMLVAGLGFAIYSPLTEENPVANLSIGALIIHSLCVILALGCGGWVAGRFTSVKSRAAAWLHGFSVWCVATVGGVLLVTLGAGWMLSGLTSLVGGGLSAAGESVGAVAEGAVDLAADAVKQSEETVSSFVDEAVGFLPDDGPQNEAIRAKREIGFAVARLFNPAKESNTAANRADAVTALSDHTGMSPAEAEETVTEWTDTYERLQADLAEVRDAAATKAGEAADSTADALATFSLWGFAGFLLGALAATGGGHLGAACAASCEEKTYAPAAGPVHNI